MNGAGGMNGADGADGADSCGARGGGGGGGGDVCSAPRAAATAATVAAAASESVTESAPADAAEEREPTRSSLLCSQPLSALLVLRGWGPARDPGGPNHQAALGFEARARYWLRQAVLFATETTPG